MSDYPEHIALALEELMALAAQAIPGPYGVDGLDILGYYITASKEIPSGIRYEFERYEDAAYLSACANMVPLLLGEIERLQTSFREIIVRETLDHSREVFDLHNQLDKLKAQESSDGR